MEGLFPGKHGGIENFIYSLIRGFNLACPDVELFLSVTSGTTEAFKEVLRGANAIYLDDEWHAEVENGSVRQGVFQSVLATAWSTRLGKRYESRKRRSWRVHCEGLVDVVLYPTWRLPVVHLTRPVVMTIHDVRWFERPETGRELTAALRNAPLSAVVTSWPDPFARLSRMLEGRGDVCAMVPFINEPPPHEGFVASPVIPRTLLYTSANGPEKNHEALIRALGILRRRGAAPVQVFCTGPLIPERAKLLDALIREEETEEWVLFLGWLPREAVRWFYRNVAGVISTTKYEAMSGTVLEGWQHGKPVACSRIASIEALTDLLGVEVAYFDPENPIDVARAIEELLANPEPYRTSGRRARERLTAITQESTALQYRDLLAWACGQARRPEWFPFYPWWTNDHARVLELERDEARRSAKLEGESEVPPRGVGIPVRGPA